jgi:hypothetical protein
MEEILTRMQGLVADSFIYAERALYADSLITFAQRRTAMCRDILAGTDSLLVLSLRQNESTFWEEIPDIVWFGLGVYVGGKN